MKRSVSVSHTDESIGSQSCPQGPRNRGLSGASTSVLVLFHPLCFVRQLLKSFTAQSKGWSCWHPGCVGTQIVAQHSNCWHGMRSPEDKRWRITAQHAMGTVNHKKGDPLSSRMTLRTVWPAGTPAAAVINFSDPCGRFWAK